MTTRIDGKRMAPTGSATPGSGWTAMTSLLGPPPSRERDRSAIARARLHYANLPAFGMKNEEGCAK